MKTREYGIAWCGARRRYRLFLSIGPAVFTRRGVWRTRTDSGLVGLNARIGRAGLGVPSVLALAHTRRLGPNSQRPWTIQPHHAVHP